MQTYTSNSSPIRTNYAVKLFESGLALYTAEVYTKNSTTNGVDLLPYASGQNLGVIPESGITHPFYVYPLPEVQSSGVPDLIKYRVSAYSRWTDQSVVKSSFVRGKMVVTFSYETQPPENTPIRSVVNESPIFLSQFLQTKILKSGEPLQFISPQIVFNSLSGQPLTNTIPQFTVGNQIFDDEESATQYAEENGGTVENTSYVSLEKKLSDFGITFPNENSHNGNFDLVQPIKNSIPISINQKNFGEYSEIEIVHSSEVSVGTVEANLIYNFGYFAIKTS